MTDFSFKIHTILYPEYLNSNSVILKAFSIKVPILGCVGVFVFTSRLWLQYVIKWCTIYTECFQINEPGGGTASGNAVLEVLLKCLEIMNNRRICVYSLSWL